MMRNAMKIVAFLFITALCCNIVNAGIKNPSQTIPVKNTQESSLSVAPLNEENQAIESRNLTTSFSALPDPLQKSQKESACSLIASALPKYNYFTRYIFYASCLIVRIQTTDLIFPFHYHW